MKSVESSGYKDASGHASGCEGGAAISGKTNFFVVTHRILERSRFSARDGLALSHDEHSIRKATLKIINLGRAQELRKRYFSTLLARRLSPVQHRRASVKERDI